MAQRAKKKPEKKETAKEKVDRQGQQMKRKAEGKNSWKATHGSAPKSARVGKDDGQRRRPSGHTNSKPQPDMEGGARGRGRGRGRVIPAWMTRKTEAMILLDATESGDKDEGHEIERKEEGTQATGRSNTGSTRRDDTKADYTEGGDNKDKARRHLRGQEKATITKTVPTPSPKGGDNVVLTGLEAAATSSMDEQGHGGPVISDYLYGSDSTDRLRLELRPPPAEVTLVAQTGTSEETNMDVQETREVGEQKQEPLTSPKAKKVTPVIRPSQTRGVIGGDQYGRTGAAWGG
jgi:hypothetical protein